MTNDVAPDETPPPDPAAPRAIFTPDELSMVSQALNVAFVNGHFTIKTIEDLLQLVYLAKGIIAKVDRLTQR